ncbi:hypothetical protein [Flavobacterium dankookense]|uniref:Lipocalin-like protein n=1 Tax=Flavobacterium dankookense TaxID=706186 RepID=A0A4R6Q7D2_9FLAO|nr:hypothetical protein [Flavobacterium dankookense]TDP57980.1 hypothetical protein BC748_2492 [Flavobacterium dankookense]
MKSKTKHSIIKSTIFCLFLIIASCSSSDNETNSQNFETAILGTWNLIEYTSTRTTAETGITETSNGGDFNYTIEFTNNPKFINTNGSYVVDVIQTNSQNQSNSFFYQINSNENQQEGVHIGEWSINNNNLITRFYDIEPNEPGSYELSSQIIELTNNRLKLKIDNASSSSENYTVTGTTYVTYER